MITPNINSQLDLFPYLKNVKMKIFVIIICCLTLNLNTLKNETAFDDDIVMVKNIFVQQGFGGIGKIFGKESFRGFCEYLDVSNAISGGRYRPLSIASFAVEQQLFGETFGNEYLKAKKSLKQLKIENAPQSKIIEAENEVQSIESKMQTEALNLSTIRHLIQVLLFTLSMVALFWFLHFYLFPQNGSIAFVATLFFVFHPVHTEVIANIKSRDEILSFLFIILSCIFIFSNAKKGEPKKLILGCISFFCALLSKEYAIVLPLILVAGISISYKQKVLEILKSKWFILLALTDAAFVLMRINIVGKVKASQKLIDVIDDPYMYANLQQTIATKIQLLDEYLRLLFFPYKLSYDYSFNHFPYVTFTNWQVWLSLIIWIGVLLATVKLWQKKHVIAFPLILFLSFFILVNNLVFNIGATMGERLIYHSSLGFCIIIAWLMYMLVARIKLADQTKMIAANLFLVIIFSLLSFKTISRNAQWKNNYTLFTNDVKIVPNSTLANGNAGSAYLNHGLSLVSDLKNSSKTDSLNTIAYADTALSFFNTAISIYPDFTDAYINRANCYKQKNDLKNMVMDWKTAASKSKGRSAVLAKNARFLLNMSNEVYQQKEYDKAVSLLRDAVLIDKQNVEIWLTLGGVEFLLGNFSEAATALEKVVELNPSSEDAKQGIVVAKGLLQLQERCIKDSMNVLNWLTAAKAYSQNEATPAAKFAYQKVLQLSPSNKEATEWLKKLEDQP